MRNTVRKYVANGGSIATANRLFCVCRPTIYNWLNNTTPRKKPARVKPDKIDNKALLRHVKEHPDKLLRERAVKFGVTTTGIWLALKRNGIKKNSKIS